MLIKNLRAEDSTTSPDRVCLCADVSYDDRPGWSEPLWFEVPNGLAHRHGLNGDPWLAALLPLAAKLGEPLRVEGPIDAVLFESSRELMEWWHYWFPSMSVVPVRGSAFWSQQGTGPSRTAQFFSGGVDSFFTVLRHVDATDPVQVDDLLVGWGFDIPLSNSSAFERVSRCLTSAAEGMGKRLVTFSTNIRNTRFGGIPWGTIGHGCAMAAVALLLERAYRRVLVPSTDGYRETGPWGSHATVDHYFSSSTMRLIHDGAAFSRFEKVALASTSPVALSALRVCWRSESDSNCGACEKCLRTMIALELCGVLERASTFAQTKLDLECVSRIYCPYTAHGSMQLYYLEMLNEARKRDRPELAGAISRAIKRSSRRQPFVELAQRLRQVQRVPVLSRLGSALDRTLLRSLIT